MRAFFVLARLRALEVLRQPSSALFMLGFPAILLLVLGGVFANGHPFERRRIALVEGRATAAEVEALTRTLTAHDELQVSRVPDRARADGMLRARMVNAVLVLDEPRSTLIVGPREELFGRGVVSVLDREIELAPLAIPRWGYVHYLFPGVLAFSILLSGLFGMGYSMVRYRQSLFLKKLATTPLSRSTFVASQIAARATLVLAQVAIVVLTAVLAFELPVSVVSLGWIALVSTLGLVTFLGVGFAIACTVRTEALMIDVINAVNLPLVFLSEMFFPLDALPAPLMHAAEVLPSTLLVRALREAVLTPAPSIAVLLPSIIGLALWSLITFAISLRLFRWHD